MNDQMIMSQIKVPRHIVVKCLDLFSTLQDQLGTISCWVIALLLLDGGMLLKLQQFVLVCPVVPTVFHFLSFIVWTTSLFSPL
jgi:hypothetical protein